MKRLLKMIKANDTRSTFEKLVDLQERAESVGDLRLASALKIAAYDLDTDDFGVAVTNIDRPHGP